MLTKVKANLVLREEEGGSHEGQGEVGQGWEEGQGRFAKAGHLAMKVYKTLIDFAVAKARVMVAFKMLEEFYNDHIMFSEETFQKGHKLDGDDYLLLVMALYL